MQVWREFQVNKSNIYQMLNNNNSVLIQSSRKSPYLQMLSCEGKWEGHVIRAGGAHTHTVVGVGGAIGQCLTLSLRALS